MEVEADVGVEDAVDEEKEQAEKSFHARLDPCTDPIGMRTNFHGQLNFPSSSAKFRLSTSQNSSPWRDPGYTSNASYKSIQRRQGLQITRTPCMPSAWCASFFVQGRG